jgi:hypothetical protein
MAKVYKQVPVESTGDDIVGGVVNVLRATLAFGDTVAKALFTIPAGAIIIDWVINVTTAFDDTGTDQVDIGVSGTAEKFAANLDVSTTGLKTTGVVAAEIGAVQATAQPVLGIYAGQNANAAAGAMVIMCRYFIP